MPERSCTPKFPTQRFSNRRRKRATPKRTLFFRSIFIVSIRFLYRKLAPEIPAANIVIKKDAPGYNVDIEKSVGLSPLFKHSKPDAHRSEIDIAFQRPDNAIASPAAPAPSLRERFEWIHQPKGPASPSPFAQGQGSPFDMPKHKPSSAILQDPKNRGVAENMLTKQVWLRRTLPEEFFVLAEQMGKEL
jgi:hypothetical protein